MSAQSTSAATAEAKKTVTLQQLALQSAYEALRAAFQVMRDRYNQELSRATTPLYLSAKETRKRNREGIVKARMAINAAWFEGLQHTMDDMRANNASVAEPPLRRYTAWLLDFLRRRADEDNITLRDYVAALVPLFTRIGRDVARSVLRAIAPQRRLVQRFFVLAARLVAEIRLKTRRTHGAGILPTRPSAIPLTVQPCAP